MKSIMCYVDLDGLGADWQSYVISKHFQGYSIEDLNQHPDRKEMLRKMYLKELCLFRNLPVIPQYAQFLKELDQRNIPWTILTAIGEDHPRPELVKSDKLIWLREKFGILPDKVIITDRSEDKHQYANTHSVLVDDFETNCQRWRRSGGMTVHVDRIWYCPIELAAKVSEQIKHLL